jgi:aarF domain-containing kinase
MIPQLDLRCEANNLERFNVHFADNNTVNFPAPLQEFTTKEILTESFIRGDRIMSYANPKANSKDREELALLGVKTVMEMLFLYDFIHGDLHPGNILVTRNKVRRGRREREKEERSRDACNKYYFTLTATHSAARSLGSSL